MYIADLGSFEYQIYALVVNLKIKRVCGIILSYSRKLTIDLISLDKKGENSAL
jgi:hypothetical protein